MCSHAGLETHMAEEFMIKSYRKDKKGQGLGIDFF